MYFGTKTIPCLMALTLAVSACGLKSVGKAPDFKPAQSSREHQAMMQVPVSTQPAITTPTDDASLWRAGRESLLGNQRASQVGDILTVVIEIDERAEISNSSSRSRNGSQSLAIPSLFGLPEKINEGLPAGASLDPAVSTNSSSSATGNGSVSRNEKLTLRVAATVVGVQQNGVLSIQGSQEVRVNFELRELLVSGYVRPADISRQNQITYDKIAAARISYGGRGQITDVQQPRYGQQITNKVLPF